MKKADRNKRVILTFDRDKARKRLEVVPLGRSQNPEDIELTLYRTEFLFKNKMFVDEYLALMEYKKSAVTSPEEYRKKQIAFAKRWDFNFDYGLSYWRPGAVWGYGIDPHKGTSTFGVDLRYPKAKILTEFKNILNVYHDDYTNRMKELKVDSDAGSYINPAYKDEWMQWLKQSYVNELKGNIPSDMQDYERYLQIWLLKESGLSWNETVKQWNESHKHEINTQTARNWYKAAVKLISEGIPGFLPFPKSSR